MSHSKVVPTWMCTQHTAPDILIPPPLMFQCQSTACAQKAYTSHHRTGSNHSGACCTVLELQQQRNHDLQTQEKDKILLSETKGCSKQRSFIYL